MSNGVTVMNPIILLGEEGGPRGAMILQGYGAPIPPQFMPWIMEAINEDLQNQEKQHDDEKQNHSRPQPAGSEGLPRPL